MPEQSSGTIRAVTRPNLLSPFSFFWEKPDERDDVWRINNVFLPLLGVALLAAGWVGWKANAVGPVLLWVFASLAAGGTAGFLFGIPKSGIPLKGEAAPASTAAAGSTAATSASNTAGTAGGAARSRPNTNLEEVSDWLTKILVGLTLVNFNELQTTIGRISVNAASAIRPQPTSADVSAATALVVGFALIGFLAVYLYMRLFVQGAIVRSDEQLNVYDNAVERASRIGREEVRQDSPADGADGVDGADGIEMMAAPAAPAMPSPETVAAAQEVANVAPPDRPDIVLQPLRKLASSYEAIRQTREYSPARTRSMAEIVQKMRPYAIAAAPYINEMVNSTSTGDHLAATVILQMKYLPEHTEWLARRLVEERAFIAHQAASALLARLRVAGVPERQAIHTAVAKAQEERAAHGISVAAIDQLIEQILAMH
jgi:hypothetical protein